METTKTDLCQDIQKEKIRNLVSSYYDMQKLRIQTGNRIVASFNIQLGQAPSTKQEDMSEEQKALIDNYRAAASRITDAYVSATKQDGKVVSIRAGKKLDSAIESSRASVEEEIADIEKQVKDNGFVMADGKIVPADADKKNKEKKDLAKKLSNRMDKLKQIRTALSLINSELDVKMIQQYDNLLRTEEEEKKIIEGEVVKHPMWDAFFKDVKGCGVMMAAVCLAYLDINKARHVSSFYRYVGIDVVPVYQGDDDEGNPIYKNEGRSMKKSHLEEQEYTTKDGQKATKLGLTYNPTVKTKLVGVLGPSFLKTARGDKYEKIYRDYRARLCQRPEYKATFDENGKEIDSMKAHRHAMANRYMIKQFLRDMWVTWRELAGYEVSDSYEVAKLGMKPHKYNESQMHQHEVHLRTTKTLNQQ